MKTESRKPTHATSVAPIGRQLSCRAGLTLVELLVTISIIAILATIFLGALQVATEEAKSMKTKSMIAKLNNLIMPRYDAYRTRRVPLNISTSQTVAMTALGLPVPPTTPLTAAQVAAVNRQIVVMNGLQRLDALHELMRLEMPDRWSDVYNAAGATNSAGAYPPITPLKLANLPALNQAYYNAYISHSSPPSLTYQNAETLYMIVSLGFVDELGGRDLFNESNVGDADGDGYPEFIDAWGTPIRFLRWAPGFTDSELNGAGGGGAGLTQVTAPNGNTAPITVLTLAGWTTQGSSYGLAHRSNAYYGKTITVYTPPTSGTMPTPAVKQTATINQSIYNGNGTTTVSLSGTGLSQALQGNETFGIDADPFDPAQVYPSGATYPADSVPFAIYPLIYSAGPDRTFGIVSDFTPAINYGLANNFPFLTDSNGQSVGTESDSLGATGEQGTISTWEPSGWLDNIHNHLIGTK